MVKREKCRGLALTRSPLVGIISSVKAIATSKSKGNKKEKDLGEGNRFRNPTMARPTKATRAVAHT